MTRVCVQAPVYARAWMLPTWLDSIDRQRSEDLEIDVAVFYEPNADGSDDGTREILENATVSTDFTLAVLTNDAWRTPRRPDDVVEHRWRCKFYRHLARMRNALADWAASEGRYDYIASWDTDITLAPGHLATLIADSGGERVVGPLVNMDRRPYSLALNYMRWLDPDRWPGWAERPLDEQLPLNTGTHDVDVVIAAFVVPLATGPCPLWIETAQGEDVGFAWSCHEAGLPMAVDTDLWGRHYMNARPLPDPRAPAETST